LVHNPAEAMAAAEAMGGTAVVKAQVLTGGRGKAGGVRVVSSPREAQAAAEQILGMSIQGMTVKEVFVAEKLDIAAEYYAGITVDRASKAVMLILSRGGGMGIEDTAAREPDKIRRWAMSGIPDVHGPNGLKGWLSRSFADDSLVEQALVVVGGMYQLFREKDCTLVEINPLAATRQNRLIAADAKVVFDDNALFRHPDISALRNPEEYTADESEAREAGLSYVSLSGEIGCMVNGAGLAMATMDGIKLAGGQPANFLDVGGSSNPRKVLDAMRILLKNHDLKAILINIFGGITRCDDIAQGILAAREQLQISVPVVIRLIGTNEEQGRRMLSDAGLRVARRMTDAIEEVVRCSKQGGSP